MAVLLDAFVGGPVGFLITTLIVVTFGEITPQVCCHKHCLFFGALLLPILKIFLVLFYPVNKPVALLLDRVFGQDDHSVVLDRNQMKSALDYQMKKSPDLLRRMESRLLKGALKSNELKVEDVMVPIERAFCLDVRANLDAILSQAMTDAGYCTLPVIDPDLDPSGNKHPTVVGLLHVKDLLVIDPACALPVRTLLALFGTNFHTIDSDASLLTLLSTLKGGTTSQLACVKKLVSREDCDPYWIHAGIVTVQDALNGLVQDDSQEKDQELKLLRPSSSMKDQSPRIISKVPGMFVDAEEISVSLPGMVVDAEENSVSLPVLPLRSISKAEAVATQGFWINMYPQIFGDVPGHSILQFILEDCQVITCSRSQVIYRRGVPADYMCLILAGALHVYAGREGFQSISLAWDFLGIEAQDGNMPSWQRCSYSPDFSACAEEGSRLLLCNRTKFLKYVAGTAVINPTCQQE